VVETYGSLFSDITYVDTFQALQARYEQIKDELSQSSSSTISGPSSLNNSVEAAKNEEEEEEYFNNVENEKEEQPVEEREFKEYKSVVRDKVEEPSFNGKKLSQDKKDLKKPKQISINLKTTKLDNNNDHPSGKEEEKDKKGKLHPRDEDEKNETLKKQKILT